MAGKSDPTRILILGGGYVGMYTALQLQKKLGRREASVTVVDPQPHMTYQPFLPEAAAGSVEPRHVVAPLRRVLKRCHVITAAVSEIKHDDKLVTIENPQTGSETLSYDVLVVALGSVPRLLPIPGLAEQGISLKTVGEAAYLRNHVLAKMDAADNTDDEELRKRLLTFTFVGGGFAGVEALAELEDMARYASRDYRNVKPEDMSWSLIEAAGRVMPEVSEKMGVYVVKALEDRNIKVYLNTFLKSVEDGHAVLSDGTEFDTETLVWNAGVKANPVLKKSDLPLDERGRIKATSHLQVEGLPGVWAAGDCAAVPDLSKAEEDPNATCAPSAQHAVRQSKQLAKNMLSSLRGKQTERYFHKYLGSVAGLGLYKGVADVNGIKAKGFVAWFMHRTYHVSKMPTFNRKLRIVVDWTLAFLFKREAVSMGQIQNPREAFERAATS
ncbi:NAD(P)/FAD-dependent oxidoreductase [Saccharopolyspora sp. HNM0983]|uniref:NAD(P)/FAD-dependent oxidoreductase n=1 Tax=Saccharopolyspora montiporae TaxID=2781240 RepID=A0A929B7V8_9PSEU|nr:NAD(P)/FAD-dependent oxidoreductase [Saccharopolyspora sp. HNM0983]MBE9373876.1 NAD(P)/FAD-dependent oxidoreductase [Saccharopolyspora sp. HNM0983]